MPIKRIIYLLSISFSLYRKFLNIFRKFSQLLPILCWPIRYFSQPIKMRLMVEELLQSFVLGVDSCHVRADDAQLVAEGVCILLGVYPRHKSYLLRLI